MTTLRQVGDALATRLRTIGGLRATADVPETVTSFPLAFPIPPEIPYESLTLTSAESTWGIVVLTSRYPERRQLDCLDYQDLSGAKSIVALIQSDSTLGLTGVRALVLGSRPLGAEEIAGYNAFGVAFDVSIRLS